jgi:L-fucose mutarotase
VPRPVAYMQVSGTADGYRSALQREILDPLGAQCEAIERFAFYDRVRGAYAIVQTGEMQPFANILFKKGVIADALRP